MDFINPLRIGAILSRSNTKEEYELCSWFLSFLKNLPGGLIMLEKLSNQAEYIYIYICMMFHRLGN